MASEESPLKSLADAAVVVLGVAYRNQPQKYVVSIEEGNTLNTEMIANSIASRRTKFRACTNTNSNISSDDVSVDAINNNESNVKTKTNANVHDEVTNSTNTNVDIRANTNTDVDANTNTNIATYSKTLAKTTSSDPLPTNGEYSVVSDSTVHHSDYGHDTCSVGTKQLSPAQKRRGGSRLQVHAHAAWCDCRCTRMQDGVTGAPY